ncbi:addiction module antidote protein, HigA family (plasmid) [Piscirickettsia salmonis]|nr:antitoxin Xre-like helix-turn-helix domain-containing protein [Piscirickettsia salmonis]QGO75239.1 addiction module antidote protein, HigA family [Piscirickettsia salmonis]QGO78821.1 addiction module antidote protein, HigA family [Piscirickettsia salmonis]
MTTKTRKPTHPGAYIADIFDNLKENGGMSRNQIAKHLGISPSTLCNIIAEKTRVNAEALLHSSKSDQFWRFAYPAATLTSN